MEKEKGREKEEKENMKAKDDSEVMGSMEAKERQRARGRSRTRWKKPERQKFQRDLRQVEEKRRAQEEEAERMWHESRKEQRIEKWVRLQMTSRKGKRRQQKKEERNVKCASGVVGVRRARTEENVESARAARRCEKKRGPETRAKR